MKKRILIIEDDSSIREFLCAVLKNEQYEVDEAIDGARGLAYLKETKHLPNLILLDIRMPNKDGFSFRADQLMIPHLANIPVVVMTSDGGIEEKSLRMKAVGRLQKPLAIDDVCGTIKPIMAAIH